MLVRINPPAHELATENGEHQPIRRHLDDDAPVSPHLALIADQRHDLVTCIQDVLHLELEVFPRLQPASPVGSNTLVAAVDARETPSNPGGAQVVCAVGETGNAQNFAIWE